MNQQDYDTLKAELDPKPQPGTPINQFELRGYELARLERDGSWSRVGTYRPNNVALGMANAACSQLNANGLGRTYQVRGVVSVELPKVNAEGDGPLVLEADEGTSATDAGDAAPSAEEVPLVTSESTPSSELEAGEHDFGLAAVDGFHHDIGGEA